MALTSRGPGAVLGERYRLDDLLEEFEGGRFWRATDMVLARNVAIHVINSTDPRAQALIDAARANVLITDPHLLRVLDCEDDG
ncbi:MAG: serine/threonine protein kinase, partial [Nocardioidaceae bacterium]|nr:serine/threonine protein kinase [Nocardioidaceae bacterium]